MRAFFISLFLGILTLSSIIVPDKSILAASEVNLVLVSASQTFLKGDTFDMTIEAQSNSQQIVGVDTYLDFDPTKLSVIDSDAEKTGIQISGGNTLNVPLWNSANNITGHIDYSAGAFNPYPSGTFTIATIRFMALAETTPTTSVTFSTSFDRPTMVIGDTQATNVTGSLTGVTYKINADNIAAPAGNSGGGAADDNKKTLRTSGLWGDKVLTLNTEGIAQNSIRLITLDGMAALNIAALTRLLDVNGHALSNLVAEPMNPIPPLSANNSLISAYTFGPSGASFSPAIILSLSYDPAALPEGILESNLYIAFYDGNSWIGLESIGDTTAKNVSTTISHFSSYALMGKIEDSTTPVPQTSREPLASDVSVLENPPPTPAVTATLKTPDISRAVRETTTEPTPPKELPPSNSTNYAFIIVLSISVVIISVISIIFLKRNYKNNKP